MHWLVYAVIAMIGTTAFNVFLKSSEGQISPLAGTFLLQLSALVMAGVMFFFHSAQADTELVWSTKGIVYSVLAGLVIMLVNFAIFSMYHHGAPLSLAVPLARTGMIVLTVFCGFVIFREPVNLEKLIGIALCLSGVYLLARNA